VLLSHYIDVVVYRASAELRAEATRTYAGYLWWILNPLLSLAVYYVAFNWILGNREEGFAIFLFSGIVFWQWFAQSIIRGSGSLLESLHLMQQVDLHKSVFPVGIVLVNTAKFAVTFVLLLVAVLLAGHRPTPAWLALVPLLAIEFALITGFACGAAAVTPLFPDFRPILETAMHLLFFMSGIFFDLSDLPQFAHLLDYNPMAVLIVEFRRILLDGTWPEWGRLLVPVGHAAVALVLSMMLLNANDKIYPKLS